MKMPPVHVEVLHEQIMNLTKAITRLEEAFMAHTEKEEANLKELKNFLDAKYASKWTEKVLLFIATAIWGWALATLSTFIKFQ